MKSLVYQYLGCLILLSALSAQAAETAPKSTLSAYPEKVQLIGNRSRQQLLVSGTQDKQTVDLTRTVKFQTDQPAVIQVDETGVIHPLANGVATVIVSDGAQSIKIPVEVKDFDKQTLIDFEHDVHPMFSRFNCNGGSCHGKQRGQGGFQLSMFAFDPEFDYAALTKESRGRRASPLAPDQSLVLLKGAGKVPHGGGKKLPANSSYYQLLEQWIAEGATRSVADTPKLVKISAYPTEQIMQPKTKQQMVVTAHYSDGSTRDVTDLAEYMSSESV
ncbi:MAG: S-layer protein, partial [Planctomycetaceae bacterium]|nr:S-layer protein [Planctomycetaceae bacterium]